ncbi:MAG: ATP phosphoribosyltransferase regulatory subunit, partial [Promethearchaeota archaeon]
MSKKFSTKPIRGMKDFYPEDMREMNWIIDNISYIAELYSFDEFKSPQLEPVEIFAAKSSDELVNEQSFIIEKKEGERLILIPELTPSLARMIAKKSQELKKPIRWWSNPTCFRYERPQRGRRRMFQQVNFDILGEESLYAELEIFNIIV